MNIGNHQVGEWVEVETPTGQTFYGKVIGIEQQPYQTIYTVHQFPADADASIHTFCVEHDDDSQPVGEYPELHGYCGRPDCIQCFFFYGRNT